MCNIRNKTMGWIKASAIKLMRDFENIKPQDKLILNNATINDDRQPRLGLAEDSRICHH